MRFSKLVAPTLREVPTDAEVISHQLMLRAGMIRKVAAGIYDYMPLGYRVIQKVAQIVREEMNKAGAQELLMPAAVPAELWKESGRWDVYGKELLRFKDRKDAEFCVGPTHEEVITEIVRGSVRSYRELPINLYQIQTKFRDEIRPRFGLMRAREFIMKDAYSFHETEESLDEEYKSMYETYCRIFARCGLKYKVVEADSGNIGGSTSQEFMVLAPTGEDALLSCNCCNYSANIEAAKAKRKVDKSKELDKTQEKIKKVSTPNQKTIEEVSAFLKVDPKQMIKTLVYCYGLEGKEDVLVVLIRGDHQINELKLKNHLGADWVTLAEDKKVEEVTKAPVGFAGPVKMKDHIKIIADLDIEYIRDGVTGANEKDAHLIHVVPDRDFKIKEKADLIQAEAGAACPKCDKGVLEEIRGIEVGHIFKLGNKYSKSMQATFLNSKGKQQPFIMGCYGIGIGRTAAAAIEQHNDEKGIIWPMALAPYQLVIVPVNSIDENQKEVSEKIYQETKAAGVEVVLDDREDRVGVKLNDADLIGYPLRIVVGAKTLAEGKVELKKRSEEAVQKIEVDRIIEEVKKILT
ncbi:MAG: proline--tRNA ligase [Candidatus Margulisbacteria bacterium]|nr:proline--tRNA ligase [Candidatus Margulisiibacteriota bacterium]